MRKLFIISLMLFSIQLYSQETTKDQYNPKYSTILNSDNGEKMIKQCSRSVPDNIDAYFDLTKEDVSILENSYNKILKIKATGCCLKGWNIKNLEDYAFQYMGVVINNRRYIYINAFIVESENDFKSWYKNWETSPIVVCDGGDGFWGVLFDLENKSFSQSSVNGIG